MNAPAPFDVLLDTIAAGLGIPQLWGAAADAAESAETRVVWVPRDPGGISSEPCPFALPGLEVISRRLMHLDVHLYAATEAELYDLHDNLGAQLDILAGPTFGRPPIGGDPARPGYEYGQASSAGPEGDDVANATWAAVVPVTLKSFVSRAALPTAPIVSVPVQVVTTDTDGSNEQQAIP